VGVADHVRSRTDRHIGLHQDDLRVLGEHRHALAEDRAADDQHAWRPCRAGMMKQRLHPGEVLACAQVV
jgi:hypothetical protein